MRVIWVTPSMPHPQGTGGCVHEFEMLHALGHRHEIHVVSADLGPLDAHPTIAAVAGFSRVPWVMYPPPSSKLGVARALARAQPNMAQWLRRDRLSALGGHVRAVAAKVDPDLVHITLGEIAPLIDEVAYPTALMLFDSLTREIEGQLALETTRRRRAQLRLEHRRTRRFERDWYSRATGIASASTVDAAWFEDLTGRQVDVVETCVPAALFAPPSVERSRGEVMFVGSLIHPPNLDAIEWLSREIWPQIVASRPDAELHIVGRGDNGPVLQRVRALVEPIGGHIHADVDDIRPYYWRAAVAIAPVRLGAGLRNKVIHAMACHAPLVASPTALEGVPAAAAEHVLVGSAAVDLANAVLRALKDPVVASRRAAAAADAIQPLEASAVASRLEAWWKRTVG